MANHVSTEAPGPEPLSYTGKVSAKGTGTPVQGATVVVRRSVFTGQESSILQETKHETDGEGKYRFTIPPEQVAEPALYIELDVEHPNYAPQKNSGYSLAMIRKNEQLGGRPFFEHIELQAGDPVTGRLQTPDGKPAAGVKILVYSQSHTAHLPEYGSFASTKTDEHGAFRLTVIQGGSAILWLLPEKFAPSSQTLEKRGDLGSFVLQPGIFLRGRVLDARGKPVAGVWVNAQQEGHPIIFQLVVGNAIRRSALTDEQGEFEMASLPPGTYQVRPNEYSCDSSRDDRQRRPLPAVFAPQKITLREGESPEQLEIRAAPHVIIEAQFVDSDGKPRSGHQCFLVGQIAGSPYFISASPDPSGNIVIQGPSGLENAELHMITNEHSALRHQIGQGGALSNLTRVPLGTLERDLRDIRIVRYRAPVLLVNALDKSRQQIRGLQVRIMYAKRRSPWGNCSPFIDRAQGDVHFEKQEDGRWRSFQLLPDEEITITLQADGYEPRSEILQLPEGEQKELAVVLEKK